MTRKSKAPATLEDISPAIDQLEQFYTFQDRDEVVKFIAENLFLVDLLIESSDKIALEFGEAQRFVEVVVDPEIETDSRLSVLINPSFSPNIAFDKLRKFRREWWFNNVNRAKNKLSITLHYQ